MKQQLLVVDDNEMMRSFLEHYFSGHYNVQTCANSREAWQRLDGGYFPDIIVVDTNTTDIDGLDFLYQLKTSVMFNDIPVIVLSSNTKSSARIECLQAGAADYICKPFNPKELELRLQYHQRLQRA